MSQKKLDFIDVPSAKAIPIPAHYAAPQYSDPHPNSQANDGLIGNTVNTFRAARHPVAALFHVLFKVLAIFFYLFGNWFSSNFIFIFVLCILMLAFDFWTVKNVTGRLLVGMRWWNKMNEDGSSEWMFESIENPSEVDQIDSKIFWTALYATPAIWLVFFISTFLSFRFTWMIIVLSAMMMSAANIVGYTKCRKDSKDKMQAFLQQGAFSALQSAGGANFLSALSSMAMGAVASSSQKPQPRAPV